MKYFWKNVLRLAIRNKGSFLGAMLITAMGIMIFIGTMDSTFSTQETMQYYFDLVHPADIYADVVGIPKQDLQRLEDMEGIRTVSGRLTEDIRIQNDASTNIVNGFVCAYDPENVLDILLLSDEPPESNEIYIGTRMQDYYHYEKGDCIHLIYNGSAVEFTYAGTCQTVMAMEILAEGANAADGAAYDLVVINKDRMEEMLGKKNICTSLSFQLQEGYTYQDVEYELSQRLQPYGLLAICEQAKQESISSVTVTMDMIGIIADVYPVLFLGVAIFMLFVILKKIIMQNRGLIGTMKAFGMTDKELIGAYLVQGLLIGLGGAIIAMLFAQYIGEYLYHVNVDYYYFPLKIYRSYTETRFVGLGLSIATGLLASYLGVHSILKIEPAQAMKPIVPNGGSKIPLPQGLQKRMGVLDTLALRSITRSPISGVLLIIAIAFAFALSVSMLSLLHAINSAIDYQYHTLKNYDLSFTLDNPKPLASTLDSVMFIDGVELAEPSTLFSVEMSKDGKTVYTYIVCQQADSKLWRIGSVDRNFYELPERGIILDVRAAEKLQLDVGDFVEVRAPDILLDSVSIPVAAVLEQCFTDFSYMSLENFCETFYTPVMMSQGLLSVRPDKKAAVIEELKKAGNITNISDMEQVIVAETDIFAPVYAVVVMVVLFSMIAGGLMIYFISMINLRERIIELGTILILGGNHHELRRMIFFEQFLYYIVGILLGIPFSKLVIIAIGGGGVVSRNPWYIIKMDILPIYCVEVGLACLLMVCISCYFQYRAIQNVPLTDILKERG